MRSYTGGRRFQSITVYQKKKIRFNFLKTVYDLSNGDTRENINADKIAREIDLADKEIRKIATYLKNEGLIESIDHRGGPLSIYITQREKGGGHSRPLLHPLQRGRSQDRKPTPGFSPGAARSPAGCSCVPTVCPSLPGVRATDGETGGIGATSL